MKPRAIYAGVVSTSSAKRSRERIVANALNSKRLAHNWAAATKNLEVRHLASSRRDIVGGGGRRERAESGGGRL